MAFTQESVLSFLIAEGGKVRKADFVSKFKDAIDADDPAEKERNKELFKTFVNNVAFVREIDGVRFVVAKKTRQRSPDGVWTAEESEPTGEQQRPPVHGRNLQGESDHPEDAKESCQDPDEMLSPIALAMQRSKFPDIRVKRALNFEILKKGGGEERLAAGSDQGARVKSKPYALPLRMPATSMEVGDVKREPAESPKQATPRSRRRPSVETGGGIGSPQLRSARSVAEDPRERIPSAVPLEQSEHEWLVRCAAGHWSQVYGLLLGDNQLAEKRDFMSGFTALHWAAKYGNSDMLEKIVSVSRRGGVDININVKTHAGYTPLHIAALHHQEYILAMLIGEYGADASIRDHSGKKAYHYLQKDTSETLSEMLGKPKAQEPRARIQPEKDDQEPCPDLHKGLYSISRMFQPNATSSKKKHKQRPTFLSVSDDPSEERAEISSSSSSSFRHRVMADVFM